MVPVKTISAAVSEILLRDEVNFAGFTICPLALTAKREINKKK